ncbi:MAG: PRC-barrel domain-containing protein [Gemmatimonadales bacterium]
MVSELKFEDLIGRTVRNSYGRPIGRIEDARVEPDGDDYVITHFVLAPEERLSRFMAFFAELPTLRELGIGHQRHLRPLPWDWFDLNDPERPVLGEGRDPR